MQFVRFPMLGIEIKVSKVAFSIGSIDIYWYAIFIMSAFIIFLIAAKKRCKKQNIVYQDILDLLLWMIPIAFLCARIYYVLFSLDQYQNWKEIFDFRSGGLAIYGGIIGGFITIALFCKKRKIKITKVTDLIVPYLALGQAIGRWGNFVNVEAYGQETNVFWRMEINQGGNWIGVHPTFLYESIADFMMFFLLILIEKRQKKQGVSTYCYLILYSFVRLIVEGFRIDSLMFFEVRISQMLSFIILVSSCFILANCFKKEKRERENDRKDRISSHES